MSPKRTPVKPEPRRKKKVPPKPTPQFDATTLPEPATPERIAEVANQPVRHQPTHDTSEGVPPQKPEGDMEDPENKAALFRWLRWSAGMYYTTDLRGCTIDQLGKHPMFRVVSIGTLARWSIEDRWVERRQINLEQWRRAIEHKIGSELVQARRKGIDRLAVIFDKIFDKLERDVVEAKSYEGLVAAFVKLADLMDNWNDKIARAVIPDMPSQLVTAGPADGAKPQLSQEEARAAAKLILHSRRAELRAKVSRAAEEAEFHATPPEGE